MPEPQNDNRPKGFFPADYASCIADVISCWAVLENNIDMSIWHLAGVYPAIGACITTQIFTLDGRMKALLALLKLRNATNNLLDRVNKFSENVRKPQAIRNRITHDCWFKNDSQKMLQLEIGAKGVLTYGFKPILIKTLQNDSDKVREAMQEASAIRDAIEAALPTLPEIPLQELHPIVLDRLVHAQTRSTDKTFLLFPPKPSQG